MVTSSVVFALVVAAQLSGGDVFAPERPPPSAGEVGYFAESPWEFGAAGQPSAQRTSLGAGLLGELQGYQAPKANTCNLCCGGLRACDAVCLGGFLSRSVSNTLYFAVVGGTIGCFGGILLGLLPAYLIATVAGALALNVGGLVAGTLLGCGTAGCMAGAGLGAPLGFFSTSLFPWWFAPRPPVTAPPVNGAPPPAVRPRRRRAPRAESSGPSVEHREERPTAEPRPSRRDDRRRRSPRKSKKDDDRSDRDDR